MADRWVQDDTMLGDVKLEGQKMFTLVYGSANRDLPDGDEPDRFDITRDARQKHYGFGEGIHYCIGAPLGRLVTGVAVSTLLETFPGVRLGAVGPWGADPYFRTLSSLQVLAR
jgi:cytochrome P450